MLHNFQRSFHALSKEHRQAYTRIGLAHDPLSLSLLFPSIITLSYYISRDQRCVRTRESAIRYLTWSFLLLSSPIHHDRDLILLITRKILLPPRGEQRILRIKETGEKITEKWAKRIAHKTSSQNTFFTSILPVYPTVILPLASFSPLPPSSSFLFYYIPLVKVSQGLHPSYAVIRSPPRNDRWRGDTSGWQESRRSTRVVVVGCREYRIEKTTNPPITRETLSPNRTPREPRYTDIVTNDLIKINQRGKHQQSLRSIDFIYLYIYIYMNANWLRCISRRIRTRERRNVSRNGSFFRAGPPGGAHWASLRFSTPPRPLPRTVYTPINHPPPLPCPAPLSSSTLQPGRWWW